MAGSAFMSMWQGVSGVLPGTLLLFGCCCLPLSAGAQAGAATGGESTNASPSAGKSLLVDLFEEGQWSACRVECQRFLDAAPNDPAVALIKAVAELRLGLDSTAALLALGASSRTPRATAAMANYELGRAFWKRGDPRAFVCLRAAFDAAESRDLFLRAGCSLNIYLEQHAELARQHAGLVAQLYSSAGLWNRQVWTESRVAPPRKRDAWTGKPAQWVIAFYRSQISPAIGERCSLVPSCSEYTVQALRRHGLLGLTIYADRGVREPDVVARKKTWVKTGSRWRYADPLDDHDWWLKP
jgi:hypothetical protein